MSIVDKDAEFNINGTWLAQEREEKEEKSRLIRCPSPHRKRDRKPIKRRWCRSPQPPK
jgi:hypothetical protein